MRKIDHETTEICEDCGKPFVTKYGFFCPECRKKRLSKSAKERKLNKIGAEAYSQQAELRREAGKK